MTFRISGKITNSTNQEVLDALDYLRNTYGTKVQFITVRGDTKDLIFSIAESTYANLLTTTSDLLQTYGENIRLYDWKINFSPEGGAYQPVKSFTIHGDASANFVMTNATQAERFAGNTTRHLFMVDLEGYSQVRLRVNQQVTSASVNTPVFRAKYCIGFNSTVGNFLTLGESEVQVSMAGTGYKDTGWVNLVSGAKINGICIGFTEVGGDGAADPALGATDILFR